MKAAMTRLPLALTMALAVGVAPALASDPPAAPKAPAATTAPADEAAAEAQDDEPDTDINRAQPDFTLVSLPTTLRLPARKGAFRITHRFTRPLGQGSLTDLLADGLGTDGGAVIGFDDDAEAIAMANDSDFGLSGAIYSADAGQAYRMALKLRTGGVAINGGAGTMQSDAPFGGIKRSGYGREYGEDGLNEFTYQKVISFHAE